MSTPILIILAVLAPVVLAAAVGFPAWFAARTHSDYIKLRDEYQAAVGIAQPKSAVVSTPGGFRLPGWMLGYYGYLIVTGVFRALHPSLGFTAHVLIFAGIGLWFTQRSLSSYSTLRAHPELELRLRRVPRIEIATWTLVALVFFAIVHIMVVIGAPAEFGPHSR